MHVAFGKFSDVFAHLTERMCSAPQVKTEKWQGVDVSKNPAATTYELLNVNVEVPLNAIEDLQHWREQINPNLPWADDHFAERVGGHPLNPGKEWFNWPWGRSAAKHRVDGVQFNHTYMERLWPKYARTTPDGLLAKNNSGRGIPHDGTSTLRHRGHALPYGDLRDLVDLLVKEPHTRQAYIPLFFPEDTGVGDGGRKVCTLGYQIIMRDNCAHIWYPLRSCDLVRHYRDDVYLAVRLLLWIIDECRKESAFWDKVVPGMYNMHMTSLHIFQNDRNNLLKHGTFQGYPAL